MNICYLAMQSFRDIVVLFKPLKHNVELIKCNLRASASSASMIVVFLSHFTNNLVATFFALAETPSTVTGTGGLMLLALHKNSI
jgi:hypothetical protein